MHESAPERPLVAPVANDVTAPEAVIAPVLRETVRTASAWRIVGPVMTPLLRSVAIGAPDRVLLPDLDALPTLGFDPGDETPRVAFMDLAIGEDGFFRHLPLPGVDRDAAGTLQWDRFRWFLNRYDFRPFVSQLPWDEHDTLLLVGGCGSLDRHALPLLLASEACRRRVPVEGRVLGPIAGRWAPLWLHACDRLHVASGDQRDELWGLGFAGEIVIDASLAPADRTRPLVPGGEELWLDLSIQTPRVAVSEALARHATQVRGLARRLIVSGSPTDLVVYRAAWGDALQRIAIEYREGDLLATALERDIRILSFEPYRVVHVASQVPTSPEVGVLEHEVRAATGGVPHRLRRHLVPVTEEVSP